MNTAPPPHTPAGRLVEKLARAMEAFDKDPQDLQPFFDCVQDMQQLRLALSKEMIATIGEPSQARALVEQTMTIIIKGVDAVHEYGPEMAKVEANENVQRALREYAAQLEDAAERLRVAARQKPPFQAAFEAARPVQEAFVAATRRVLADRDELTPPLRDAAGATKDIEDDARRITLMLEAGAEQNKRLESLAGDADTTLKKFVLIRETSEEYVRNLTAELTSCTRGVATPVAVRKSLCLRKPDSPAQ